MRDYPRFKLEYERLMKTNLGSYPYTLKQCLSKDALAAVKGVDHNYEMFVRLDQKYGNTRKIVDAVVFDFKSVKKLIEGDAGSFVSMVDKV